MVSRLDTNKDLIRRYYSDLWNRRDDAVIDEIIAPNIQFRGSLGVTVSGRQGFRGYVAQVRAAFPNRVDSLLAENDEVLAQLTYIGTHQGNLYGTAPTHKKVEYGGLAVFKVYDGKIVSGLVYGDTVGLMRQIGFEFPGVP